MILDLLSVGRISVDLYAQEPNHSFSDPQTFMKSIGGSPTNVAVAAARLGLKSALATKVGGDLLAPFVLAKLAGFGVDTSYVGVDPQGLTPVVLASLDPPADPAIIFYRGAGAPDTTIVATDVPERVVRDCRVLWVSACALAVGTTADACFTWLDQRGRAAHTIIDLDYRPTLWADRADARRAAQRAIDACTVVVGNRDECEMAIGETDPETAADALLSRGVRLAIVKMGADGVLLATEHERVRVHPLPIDVACGLGAGDAFGGALAYGLLQGWPLVRVGELANAAGAFVASRLMCADAMPDLPSLTSFVLDHRKGSAA